MGLSPFLSLFESIGLVQGNRARPEGWVKLSRETSGGQDERLYMKPVSERIKKYLWIIPIDLKPVS